MLERAIGSCLDQTTPCEIVVIDEASTDGTSDLVRGIPELKYIRNEKPLGHSAAANIGIKAACGQWIKPLDDDDWLAPNCIKKMSLAISAAKSQGFKPVLVSGAAVNVDKDGREINRTHPLADAPVILKSRDALQLMLIDQAPIGTPVQVGHERETALLVNGWNEHRLFSHQHGDEVELWIKLVGKGDVLFIPDYVANRTMWSGGSQDRIPPEERYLSNVYLKDLITAEMGVRTPERLKSYLALHWAVVAVKNKKFGQALKLGIRWMKQPGSATDLFKRRSANRVLPIAATLTVSEYEERGPE
jgi:glycosyltransferase involved in cell wall biosynthesis